MRAPRVSTSRRKVVIAFHAAVLTLALAACDGPAAADPGTGEPTVTGPTVAAPSACQVTYRAAVGPAGYTADVTVTEAGGNIAPWTVGFDLGAADQRLSHGWSADWTQSGTQVTAVVKDAALAAHTPATIGFNATGNPTAAPSQFTLNGVPCRVTASADGTPIQAGPARTPSLKVSGRKLVDAGGSTVQLAGVNRSGGEFSCVKGGSIWDGPMDDQSIAAIASWDVNTVRLPLNEDCWLGLNSRHPDSNGAAYRVAVAGAVARLEAQGLVPILDLHWTDGVWTGAESQCSDYIATCQKPMPDRAHSLDFWSSVADTFKADQSVVFDLFNEPFSTNIHTMSQQQAWKCWRDGGDACPGVTFPAAGMQQMLDAVRGVGAHNVVIATANSYGQQVDQYASHQLHDPLGNVVVGWHWYNNSSCRDASCWNEKLQSVSVPLIASEIGEFDCSSNGVRPMMQWADTHGVSFLAWTWNTWDCNKGPALVSDYSGDPTGYGAGVRDYLQSRHR